MAIKKARTVSVVHKAKPLDPELMNHMARSLGNLSPSQRSDMNSRTLYLTRMLEESFPGQHRRKQAGILLSFEFRLKALAQLREQPEYKAWTLQIGAADRADMIHEVLIFVAATQPLLSENNEPVFAPNPFFEKVIQVSETRGRA